MGLVSVPLFTGAPDKFGRRGAILFALFGMSVECVVATVTVAWQLSLWALVAASVVSGSTGGVVSLLAGSSAFVADTTECSSRSLGLTALDVLLAGSIGLSQLAVGFLIAKSGFFIPAAASAACMMLNFTFCLLFLPETRPNSARNLRLLTSPFHYASEVFADFQRTGTSILLPLLLLPTIFTASFTKKGDFGILVLFAMNRPLCLNSIGIGVYLTARLLAVQVGMLAIVRLLIGKFDLLVLAAAGCLSSSLFFAVLGFVQTAPQLLVATVVEILGDSAPPLIRSFLSQVMMRLNSH
jgi:PCFT/HCP family folate transporter-like MFS transporter 1/3